MLALASVCSFVVILSSVLLVTCCLLVFPLFVVTCYFCWTPLLSVHICIFRQPDILSECYSGSSRVYPRSSNVSPRRRVHVNRKCQSTSTSSPEGRKLARQSRNGFLDFARVSANQLLQLARCDLVWALLGQIRERQKCSSEISNVWINVRFVCNDTCLFASIAFLVYSLIFI